MEKTTWQGALLFVILTKHSGDQIKKDEMGGEFNKYGEEEIWAHGFGGETWGDREHLEDLGIDGRIMLK